MPGTEPAIRDNRTRSNVGDNRTVQSQDGVGRMQASLPLQSPTPSAVAQVLRELLPGVDTTVVDWGRWDTDGDPRYHRRSIAIAGGELVAKFAWSDEAAGPIAREGHILEILGQAGLPVPQVVARHPDVACFVTRGYRADR